MQAQQLVTQIGFFSNGATAATSAPVTKNPPRPVVVNRPAPPVKRKLEAVRAPARQASGGNGWQQF